MAVPRKKRVRDWCPGGGLDVEPGAFTFNGASRRSPRGMKKKYVRCAACDQRFEVHNRECGDSGCVHHRVPKHKAF